MARTRVARAAHKYITSLSVVSSGTHLGASPETKFHEARLVNLVTTTNAAGKVSSRGMVSGLDLVVSSPDVAKPMALRYLADGKDFSPLHNEMDLPLGAFSVTADASSTD